MLHEDLPRRRELGGRELEPLPGLVSPTLRFERFVDDPESVVKELPLAWLEKTVAPKKPDESDLDYLVRIKSRGSMAIIDFSEAIGIRNAGTELLIVDNGEARPSLYRVTEMVHGLDLEEAIRSGIVPELEVEQRFRSIVDFYKSKKDTGEDFPIDVAYVTSYRYGNKAGEPGVTTQLVDTDPVYGDSMGSEDPGSSYYKIGNTFRMLEESLGEVDAVRAYAFIPGMRQEIEDYMSTNGLFY